MPIALKTLLANHCRHANAMLLCRVSFRLGAGDGAAQASIRSLTLVAICHFQETEEIRPVSKKRQQCFGIKFLTPLYTTPKGVSFISLVAVAWGDVVKDRTSGLVTTKAWAGVDALISHACSVGWTILIQDTLRAATRILQRGNSFK